MIHFIILCILMAFYSVTLSLYLHMKLALYLYFAYELWDHLMVYFLDLASLTFDLTSMDLSIYEKSIAAIFTFFSL